jgi:magnesium-transporting ATPase (P-type)
MSSQGERVLGLAMLGLDPVAWPASLTPADLKAREEALPSHGLTFIGLISLVDPPKPGVDEAVLRCCVMMMMRMMMMMMVVVAVVSP